MSCEQARFTIGADPAGSAAALEDHLRDCASCRQFREEMRTLDANIRRALERPPEWLGTPRTIRSRFGCDHAPPWIVLRHIVNHSTYHRGQVASKLKRLGVDPPSTEFVDWALAQLTQTE